jgi:hypothetical protein
LPLDLQTVTSYGDQNHPNETQNPFQGIALYGYALIELIESYGSEFEDPKVAAGRFVTSPSPGNEKTLIPTRSGREHKSPGPKTSAVLGPD